MTRLKTSRLADIAYGLATLLLLAWPGAHYAFHRFSQNDPWRLAGWAMYTVPQPRFAWKLELVTSSNKRAAAACEAVFLDYIRWRHAFGRLAPLSPVVACLAEVAPDGGRMTIIEQRFDSSRAQFVAHASRHELRGGSR